MSDPKPWWEFTIGDVLFFSAFLFGWYVLFGPPSYWWTWAMLPASILYGKWVSHKLKNWLKGRHE